MNPIDTLLTLAQTTFNPLTKISTLRSAAKLQQKQYPTLLVENAMHLRIIPASLLDLNMIFNYGSSQSPGTEEGKINTLDTRTLNCAVQEWVLGC